MSFVYDAVRQMNPLAMKLGEKIDGLQKKKPYLQ